MTKDLSAKISSLSEQELINTNGGVVFLIPPAVAAIAKGAALIAGSGLAGGLCGYGLYKIFD